MYEQNKALGAWSGIGTYALLLLVAVKLGALGTVATGVIALLTGSVNLITSGPTTFVMMVGAVIAAVVLELPATVGAAVGQGMLLGKSGRHSLSDLFRMMTDGNYFFIFFIVVLAEEIFARGIFLGILPKLPFLSGPIAFYVLFLLGNGIWALIHLSNFKEEKDRHPLRVLPQFVGGIFFTYIFVKYGLLASVLTHFASNAVVFASHKIQRVGTIDVLIMLYAALCAGVSYLTMDKPVSDVLVWFANEPTFVLPGWGFWDYLKISIFIPSCLGLASSLLVYDRGAPSEEDKEKSLGIIGYVLTIPIAIGILLGLYALLGLVISNVPYRILILGILFAFFQKSASGSAMSRTFWMLLPDVYIAVCILQALGWWVSLGWLAVSTAINAPRMVLAKLDDD